MAPSTAFNSIVNDVPAATSAVPVIFGETGDKENAGASIMTPVRVPKMPKPSAFGSTKLDDAVQKACDSIKPVSVKQGNQIEDAFTMMSRHVISNDFFYYVYLTIPFRKTLAITSLLQGRDCVQVMQT